jgi:RNA polymerase sigma factor (sigma-70 family)
MSALRAYPRLRDGRNLKSWVLTIAYRKAIDLIRRRDNAALPVADLPEVAVEGAREPDDGLWRAVAGLPSKQRVAVVHRFVNDLAYRDIAAVMSITPEAARRNVHEGLKRLREERVND